MDGDEHGTWVDAHLTDVGIAQAQNAHDTWAQEFAIGIPAPQSYYVSPLHRCCQTAQVTFEGLDMPLTSPFQPLVKEVRHPPEFNALHEAGLVCVNIKSV